MNDRNAFLQGQGSPIKDDAPPPTQGWRGEKSADQSPASADQRRSVPGVKAPVEEISGTAYAESQGLSWTGRDDEGGAGDPTIRAGTARPPRSDGVQDLNMGGDSAGGESAGAPYPNPHGSGEGRKSGSIMDHGGQSEIAYHGPGHLGDDKVDDAENRNGVTESDD